MFYDKLKLSSMDLSEDIARTLDLMDDCVFFADNEGKIIFYNHAGEKMHNLKKEFVIGRHITECFSVNEETSITLQAIHKKQPLFDVYQDYITASGNHITSVSSSYPLFNKNELIGAMTVTKNITKFESMLNILYKDRDRLHINDSSNKLVENYTFDHIIGSSPLLKMNINIARKVSQTRSPVLLYGDTGTGKEVFAQSIHNAGSRKGPFITLNCAAVPENLLEGILFGTAKGAFTGAIDRAGLFEEASQGTLFLDELNSMSINLQSKLLRVIETGKIRRVGEISERAIDSRIISALNVPPLKAIENGVLRQDLFYRLGVVLIKLPSLAERKEDIAALTDHFIKKYNKDFGRHVRGVVPEVMEIFMEYSWPGNVRELEHSIEYAMNLIEDEPLIIKEYLPVTILEQSFAEYPNGNESHAHTARLDQHRDLKTFIEEVERETILNTLRAMDGNISAAAKKLGLHRQGLEYKLKKYEL